MKDFFKNVFATVVGIIVFTLIVGIIGVMSIVGMVASTSATTNVDDNSVLVLDLDGTVEERAESDMLGSIMGESSAALGLEDMLNAIRKAKESDKIKGIYIEAGMFSADAPASTQALRKALVDFKKSGKWIVAYGDQYTQSTYYLASVADKVWLNPSGMIDWRGFGSTPYYLKDAMEKFGVKMQLAKVGSYKSAPEMFTDNKMSEPNREQITRYITGIWETYLKDMTIRKRFPVVLDDARRAFAHYLEHMNGGRPFVLAGFSQGGQIVVELLKEMPDSIAQRMVAAYVLGWKISEEELAKYPVIQPAQRSDDTGVTVCYNSVSSPEAASELVSGGNVVAINPVNWRTDSTPAILHDSLTVRLDQATKLLIVSGYDRVDYDTTFFRPGCYHTFEIRWYSDRLRENMETRTRVWLQENGLEESGDWVIPTAA